MRMANGCTGPGLLLCITPIVKSPEKLIEPRNWQSLKEWEEECPLPGDCACSMKNPEGNYTYLHYMDLTKNQWTQSQLAAPASAALSCWVFWCLVDQPSPGQALQASIVRGSLRPSATQSLHEEVLTHPEEAPGKGTREHLFSTVLSRSHGTSTPTFTFCLWKRDIIVNEVLQIDGGFDI